MLRQRLETFRAEISLLPSDLNISGYQDHVSEVITWLERDLARAQAAKSEKLRSRFLFQVDVGIRALLIEKDRMHLISKSRMRKEWLGLCNFVDHYSNRITLPVKPLSFLSDSYYSSGSFTYYPLASRLQKEFYLLSVDGSDLPIFWPLALHEIAHCWLSKQDYVDSICGRHLRDIGSLATQLAGDRVEESLCDVIATIIIGPAYPYAFLGKMWPRLLFQQDKHYPSFAFRLECMAATLDVHGFDAEAAEIRMISAQKIDENWQDEEISWVYSELKQLFTDIESPDAETLRKEASGSYRNFDSSPPTNLPALFLAAWFFVLEREVGALASSTEKISSTILSVLERGAVPSDS